MQTKISDIYSEVESKVWPVFMNRGHKEFHFIRMEGNNLRVNRRFRRGGETHESFYYLPVTDVDTDNLKFLGVWDGLSEDVKSKLVRLDDGDVEEAQSRMDHARKHRRGKYPGVPSELECVNCHDMVKMSPGVIIKKGEKVAAEKGVLFILDDFIKSFVCCKCNPVRRGRAPNHNLPPKIELVCKCGNKVIYPASVALKFAEKKGMKVEEYVSGYRCQTCAPSKGRKKVKK